MPIKNAASMIARAVKNIKPQQAQAMAPRGGRGFGAALINALQQIPQQAGTPPRRGVMGAAPQAAQVGVLRPTTMKKGGAVKKVAAKKTVMKAKARKK